MIKLDHRHYFSPKEIAAAINAGGDCRRQVSEKWIIRHIRAGRISHLKGHTRPYLVPRQNAEAYFEIEL